MESLHPSDPSRVGSYRLTARLGSGGMGKVYLARTPSGRQVVIKVIRSEHAENLEFRTRFAREAEIARRVGGFHTAQVVDADPDADPPWIATAHIPGPTLDEAVRAHGPIAPPALHVLAAGLAEGLKAVHACGLVHRDLKPGNIILTHDGPRIIDFGIARPLDASSVTAQGAVFGTLPYMSPEQTDGSHVDPPSDVFSLGTVLAYAATGTNPFSRGTMAETLLRIISPAPDPGDMAEDMRALIADCWQHDPALRPTPEQILDRFEALDLQDAWPPPHLAAADPPSPSTGPSSQPPFSDPPAAHAQGSHPPNSIPPAPGPPAYRPPHSHPPPSDPSAQWRPAQGPPPRAAGFRAQPPPRPMAPSPTPAQAPQPATTGRAVGQAIVGFVAVATVGILIVAGFVWLSSPDDTTDTDSGPIVSSDVDTSSALGTFAHGSSVESVAISPDGTRLATGGTDGTARVWDVATGDELATLEGHTDWIRSVDFNTDGTLLATGSDDRTARVWDIEAGESTATLEGHTDWVRSVDFHPDGTTLATGGDDRTARVWDIASGDETASMEGHTDWIRTVAFNADGTVLASGSDDGTVRLWDPDDGTSTDTLEGSEGFLLDLAFSPDGTALAAGSTSPPAHVWETGNGGETASLSGHSDRIEAVAFGPDGATLFTGSADGTARVWDATTGEEISTVDMEDYVIAVHSDQNGTSVATAADDGTVQLWSLD
ncbi:protein kinase [Nocardiopsis aegyptia]|uniref:WD40 repeat domain-containing serine/threonine protein kinase n=1 Tax=Nocardiopsis aegyptia TaxID=220378 RepID=UPI00366DB743